MPQTVPSAGPGLVKQRISVLAHGRVCDESSLPHITIIEHIELLVQMVFGLRDVVPELGRCTLMMQHCKQLIRG